MQHLLSRVRRAVEDYNMISPGDRIAVGVSGGKDSLSALWALSELRRFYPAPFELEAITVDMGFDLDLTPVTHLCERLSVPHTIVPTQIREVVFDIRKEENPCSLCAKLRRGAINTAVNERGCTKLAYGHHYDDAVETYLMNLVFEGRIGCFTPVTFLDRTGVTVIRPLIYTPETMLRNAAEQLDLPVAPKVCPADGNTKREEIKLLIASLAKTYPDFKEKIMGAMQRLPLTGWEILTKKTEN